MIDKKNNQTTRHCAGQNSRYQRFNSFFRRPPHDTGKYIITPNRIMMHDKTIPCSYPNTQHRVNKIQPSRNQYTPPKNILNKLKPTDAAPQKNERPTTSTKKDTSLTIFHQNTDRISNKIDMMTDLLNNINPDVLIITEHGLSKSNLENTNLEGYTLIESFCREHHQKGGVAILVKDELKNYASGLERNIHSQELVCELSAIKLTIKKQTTYIVGIYRPNTNLDEAIDILSSTLETIPTWNSPALIIGDINIDCIETNRNNNQLQETLNSYNITRHQLPPTRITPNTATSIDMVCSNQIPCEPTVNIINTFISDHTGQLVTLNNNKFKPFDQIMYSRHFTDRNLALLNRLLKQETWNDILRLETVEDTYNIFLGILTYNMDVACPYTRTRKRKPQQPIVLNQETMEKRNQFLAAQEKYLLTGSHENKAKATEKKREYDIHLKNQRKLKTSEHINKAENKSKAIWNIINKERRKGKNGNETIKLNNNGTLISDPIMVADHFNKFFANIANNTLLQATYDGHLVTRPSTIHNIQDTLTLSPTTEQEVRKTIQTMKQKNSAGFDDISTKLIKACKDHLILPLTNIINKSFAQGIFPTKLKLAKVYPKLKKGDPTQASNYRPISLLPAISKIIEKIVLSRLLNHLSNNNLLPQEQHGFMGGKSTSTGLTSIVEYLIKALDKGDTTTAIFLDFTKAFDCLSHDMLMTKLKARGVVGKTADWFTSYLTDRMQTVEIRSTTQGMTTKTISTPLPVSRGVPQGSVLGPILYIIFVSDFPDYLREYCSMLLYADDTVLLLQNKKPTSLEIDSYIAINMAIEYCQANDLVLNSTKTQQLILGRSKGEVLELPEAERMQNVKYLGLVLDETLSWNDQLDQLCGKLSTSLYVLRRLKQVASPEIIKCAYFALFESHLRYGIAIWGSSSKTNTNRAMVLQKKAIRIMSGLGPIDSCREAFKNLNILTTVALFILEVTVHASQQNIPRRADVHSHNTRAANNYSLPTHRLTLFEKQPTYTGAKFLNILPPEVKNHTADKQQFRRELTRWLQERPFYSIEEFLNWSTNNLFTLSQPM